MRPALDCIIRVDPCDMDETFLGGLRKIADLLSHLLPTAHPQGEPRSDTTEVTYSAAGVRRALRRGYLELAVTTWQAMRTAKGRAQGLSEIAAKRAATKAAICRAAKVDYRDLRRWMHGELPAGGKPDMRIRAVLLGP
jgi:hypothetical protein